MGVEVVFLSGFDGSFFTIVFQKVCKSQFYYFCNGNFKNEKLWNLHMNKFLK